MKQLLKLHIKKEAPNSEPLDHFVGENTYSDRRTPLALVSRLIEMVISMARPDTIRTLTLRPLAQAVATAGAVWTVMFAVEAKVNIESEPLYKMMERRGVCLPTVVMLLGF